MDKQKEVTEEIAKRKRPDISEMMSIQTKPGDNTKFLRHALEAFDLPPIDISDIKQIEERTVWYLTKCIEEDMKPGIVALCTALGINRRTFYQWSIGEYRASTHKAFVNKVQNVMEQMMEAYMMNGKINPISGIFLMKNNFGYADKQEFVLTPNNPLGEQKDTKEIEQRYLNSIVEETESE